MRNGIDAVTENLYLSEEFDLHSRLRVENGSGSLVNLSGRYTRYLHKMPSPSTPIASLDIDFIRELTRDNEASSLAPTIATSSFNRLDDGVTYSPLLQLGRLVTFEVALTPVNGQRPPDNSTLWYETFRGYIKKVDWPTEDSHKASITCNDLAGILEIAKTYQSYTYNAGTELDEVARQILSNNGFGSVVIDYQLPDGKVIPVDYEPGIQKSIWKQLWDLAQSVGGLVNYRYTNRNDLALTFYMPAREKTVPDMELEVFDYGMLNIDEDEVRNVGSLAFYDEEGAHRIIGPIKDQVSIAKYGGSFGIERPFWISLELDSPIRSESEAYEMLNAALSDVTDPDVVGTAQSFPLVFAEPGTDRYMFYEQGRQFDSDQFFAPYEITVEEAAGTLPFSNISFRGLPTAGASSWRRMGSVPGEADLLGILDFTYRQINEFEYEIRWVEGPLVDMVFIYDYVYNLPEPIFVWPPTEAEAREGAPYLSPTLELPSGERVYIARIPDIGKRRYIQIEGRNLTTMKSGSGKRLKIEAPAPVVNAELRAEPTAGGRIDLYLDMSANAQAYPISVMIREGSKTGTLLATHTFENNGTIGPSDYAVLGGRVFPASGRRSWWARITDVSGSVRWVSADAEAPQRPRITMRQAVGSNGFLFANIHVTVIDEYGRGGTLLYWLRREDWQDADVSLANDGAFTVGSTPSTIGPSQVNLFENIRLHPARGKRLFFEFTTEGGLSTGPQEFRLAPTIEIIDPDGVLGPNALDRPAQFAASLRPPRRVDDRTLEVGAYVGDVIFDRTDATFWQWSGTEWQPVDHEAQEFGYFASIAAQAIGTRELAFGAATGSRLNVASHFVQGVIWSDNSPSAGHVSWTGGELTYRGQTYIISAGSTSDEVIWWNLASPNGLFAHSAAAFDAYVLDGTFNTKADKIIAYNDNGKLREMWNGTMIAGGHMINESVLTRHVSTELISAIGEDAELRIDAALTIFEGNLQVDYDLLVKGTIDAMFATFKDVEVENSITAHLATFNFLEAIQAEITDLTSISGIFRGTLRIGQSGGGVEFLDEVENVSFSLQSVPAGNGNFFPGFSLGGYLSGNTIAGAHFVYAPTLDVLDQLRLAGQIVHVAGTGGVVPNNAKVLYII
jgi:hypothetical protein